MKTTKYFMCFLLSLILLTTNILSANATGSFDGFEKTGTWGNYSAWVNPDPEDEALMPSSGYFYFYKHSDGKVRYYQRGDVLADIVTRKIGIVMEPSRLVTFISGYDSWLANDPNYYNTMVPVLNGDTMVGVALNSLIGGTMGSNTQNNNQSLSVPSSEVNNVYNYYQYWIEHDGKITPDYINIKGWSSSQVVGLLNTSGTYYSQWASALGSVSCGFSTYGALSYHHSNNTVDQTNNKQFYVIPTDCILTGLTSNLAESLGLTAANDTITYDQLLTKSYSFQIICKHKSDYTNYPMGFIQNGTQYAAGSNTYVGQTSGGTSTTNIIIGDITLWRDTNVVNQITNNVYKAPSYTTNNYHNFNPSSPDNGYDTNSNQLFNATTNNSNVYTETNTSNNTEISNQISNVNNTTTNVDNSSIVTNTTNIVNTYYNTYYPDNGGTGDNDNPDNPSGGDGGIEDDSILDALLAAILKLLRAIGKIIATILTGIIEIISDVLDAIANITTAFGGIIDFIASIFGFLPNECIAVLTLGLTLSVLIALIKMFGK